MLLSSICIILCNPDESRNIGSVCRALKTMGITRLRIIAHKENYDDAQVRRLAVHAADIWEHCEFFETLSDAIQDCALTAGTTRRRGKYRKAFSCTPEQFAEHLCTGEYQNASIALVFGNERTGLTDTELDACSLAISIPTDDAFPSLNLSHAVQIITYTLFRAQDTRSHGYTALNEAQIEKTSAHIIQKLHHIGFFSLSGKQDMQLFWHSLLARAALSQSEQQYLEKIFDKTEGLFLKKSNMLRKNDITTTED